jgi:HEAT repeat protein
MSPDSSEKDWHDRYRAIRAARDRRDPAYLIGALRDPDHRAMAAGYVADLGAAEATSHLVRLLDAREPHVRASAVDALGDLRATEALPAIREIAASDEEDFVRSWAVVAVGKIAGTEDTEFLIDFLHDPSMRVRAAAALALGRRGDPTALGALAQAKPKLRKAPLEWYLYRRVYKDAAGSIREGRPRGVIAKASRRS